MYEHYSMANKISLLMVNNVGEALNTVGETLKNVD